MLAPLGLLALSLLVQGSTSEGPDAELLARLVSRCGSEVGWCTSWDAAAKRAEAEHKPILVLVHSLPGFDMPDGAMLGPFMDEDIIELTRECFVPLRFSKEMSAPFVAQEAYGMGPFTFGTSILIATQDGRIVGDTFTLESSSLYDFLSGHVAPAAPPAGLSGLELAAWHVRRGELTTASELLAKIEGPRAERLRAVILHRRRHAEPALAALTRARKAGGENPAEGAVMEAALLMRLERTDDALTALARVPAGHADAAAAAFLKGALLLTKRDLSGAAQIWTQLVKTQPENRYAWLAAAYLGAGPALLVRSDRHAWPAADVLGTLVHRKGEVLPASSAGPAERTALAFLLAQQRQDGSWISPEEVMNPGDTRINPFVIAVTALCARALLPFLDEPHVEDAVTRALGFVRATRLEPNDYPGVMDYTVWSKPCLLLFLASAIEAGIAEPSEWRPVMSALVAEMLPKQKAGGGFSYYQGGDPAHLDPSLNVSFSFVTAFVLVALAATKEAGVEVPDEMTEKAVRCLARMKNADGTFEYSLVHANETAPRSPTPAGSAGRGPLCSVALRLFGRADLDDVRRALDQFLAHRETYLREHGKTLMHCGLEGQGSHYLMFDYAFAASAIALLPASEQPQYRTPLLTQILAARSDAGSYTDNPILGDHYGTGMALWAFEQLHEKP